MRQVRAERDELRKRDSSWRAQVEQLRTKLAGLQPLQEQAGMLQESVETLEDLLGAGVGAGAGTGAGAMGEEGPTLAER